MSSRRSAAAYASVLRALSKRRSRRAPTEQRYLELLTLEGYQDLLRGTPLNTILSGFGVLFKNSMGSAATYLLSMPVELLDYFVSHNWVASRQWKHLSL